MMLGELLAHDIKPIGIALVIEAYFALSLSTPAYFISLLLHAYPIFWSLAIFMAAATFFAFKILFETKSKSITDIQIQLSIIQFFPRKFRKFYLLFLFLCASPYLYAYMYYAYKKHQ